MSPYKQSVLDALCGIYSILNSLRILINKMSDRDAMRLFGRCIRHLEKRESLSKIITSGMCAGQIWDLLNELVLVKYPKINVERPFYRNGKISIKDYLQELRDYFEQGGKRTVIILVDDGDGRHWTVIQAVTSKQILLFDSSTMKVINIARCVVNKKQIKDNQYKITPSMTFYLYKK